ncbi:DUF1963 domain-containing protein [Sulfitobacter guttiformis]|uniref:Uncharacterized protein DUF1963 n=1 Tax=Sulfitobacter guttiformis TaxID=74349 RepID=A0A420DUA4_9RHOB|nr:DUF1963 domain-containing protein [Sulfitobacter guttiformis]KIN71378.1 DUF1963 domain containing protein [Sulfitobacter guttiformis KCTC 32187]RKE97825.1 uncharacterized protein DUF1963 [Sulfitobacter guttiformis]
MFGWLKKFMGGGGKYAPPPYLQGPLSDAELRRALERTSAPLVFSKPANIDPFATMFGTVRLAQQGEAWPSHGGTPMWPLCQINLTQAPLIPERLGDLSLITLFIAPDHATAPTRIIDTRNPDPAATWALRSYPTLGGLTIPKAPTHGSALSPRFGEWEGLRSDYANYDVAGQVIDTEKNDPGAYDWSATIQKTKLGGWPATVQSEPWWDYTKSRDNWDFVMQIENEPAAGWSGWGEGAAFIARSRQRPHLWAIDVQFT